jgi:hypothetical protein
MQSTRILQERIHQLERIVGTAPAASHPPISASLADTALALSGLSAQNTDIRAFLTLHSTPSLLVDHHHPSIPLDVRKRDLVLVAQDDLIRYAQQVCVWGLAL